MSLPALLTPFVHPNEKASTDKLPTPVGAIILSQEVNGEPYHLYANVLRSHNIQKHGILTRLMRLGLSGLGIKVVNFRSTDNFAT